MAESVKDHVSVLIVGQLPNANSKNVSNASWFDCALQNGRLLEMEWAQYFKSLTNRMPGVQISCIIISHFPTISPHSILQVFIRTLCILVLFIFLVYFSFVSFSIGCVARLRCQLSSCSPIFILFLDFNFDIFFWGAMQVQKKLWCP